MTLDEGIIHVKDVARSKHEAATYLADEHPTQAEKCEECAREHEQFAEWLKELKAYRNKSEIPTSCGDAISRQTVMEHYSTGEIANCHHISRNNLLDFIEQLPSVTPQQRTGAEVLDKIRERVELEKLGYPPSAGYYRAIMKVLQIIDKYKAESEDKE